MAAAATRSSSLLLERLDHRREEVLLVAEVVVEGAPRDAGTPDDLLGGDVRRSRASLNRPRAASSRALRVASDCSALRFLTFILYVC